MRFIRSRALLRRTVLFAAIVFAVALAGVTRAEAASCYPATSVSAHALCFLDFSAYSGTGNYNFTFTLPDGSTITGTLGNPGTVSVPTVAAPVYPDTSYGGVAFGDAEYLGVLGKPVFYIPTSKTNFSPLTLSAMTLTDAGGNVVSPIRVAGIDAESTDSGDGTGQGYIQWSSTGTAPAQLQLMTAPNGTTTACTLTGTGTATVTCTATAVAAPEAAYIFTSGVSSTQSFTMSELTTGARQGFAFGLDLASIDASKTVASRENPGDQFSVQILRGTTAFASASTGAGTTATTNVQEVVPGDTYVVDEVASSGTLANYATRVTCVNTTTGAAAKNSGGTNVTNLPATSETFVPAVDEQIACTFTNTALTLTNAASAAQAVAPGQSVTDTFTLTNTSLIAGTFKIAQPTAVAADGTSLKPTGYVFGGTTYTTLAALQAAINAAGATAPGGTIAVGVIYTVPQANGASVKTTLPATIASGASASPQAAPSETDTLPYATLTIVKTGTTTASPSGLIAYSIVVTNTGPNAADNAVFSDTMPASGTAPATFVTITGTPSCGSVSGGAVCGNVSTSGTNPQTVSSTIATLPSGGSVTFTITASAASGGTYTNTASIAPPAGIGGPTQQSQLTTTVAQSNGLAKTVQNITAGSAAGAADTAKPGDILQYVLTFTNTTGQPIYGVAVTDVVPAQTTYAAGSVSCVVAPASGAAPACTPNVATSGTTTTIGGVLPTLASGGNPLAPGSTVTLTFRVTVN